mmetsp:Transcript_37072/g.105274  ORF Transcript_37072/g.105274 Transcript_37072/m.105274 type:complete len:200 (+) Transcript_37072:1159-1758(+)
MTLQGMVPKMPCMIMTQKVGILKNCSKLFTSATTAWQPFFSPWAACTEASSRGGSTMKTVTSPDTITEIIPTNTKATRQPWKPKTLSGAIGTTVMVVTNMPSSSADCTMLKILPRCFPADTSAMMPLEMGRSAASSTPLSALSKIIGIMSVTKAKRMVTRPWPMAPSNKIVRRCRMPRSARIPQKGAAKFAATACETVM